MADSSSQKTEQVEAINQIQKGASEQGQMQSSSTTNTEAELQFNNYVYDQNVKGFG